MISLHKDPEGTSMFSKHQQNVSSFHSQPQNRESDFALSVRKKSHLVQSTDHSTTSEVESLKRRISELESKLASMQEVQDSSTPVWHYYGNHHDQNNWAIAIANAL